MSESKFGGAKTMPIQGSGCGIRPTEEALAVNYGIDFSKAKAFLLEKDKDSEHTLPIEQASKSEDQGLA